MHPSTDRLTVDELSRLRGDVVVSLQNHFSISNPNPPGELLLLTTNELADRLTWSLAEIDRQFIFSLLAEIEALFRADFKRRKDAKLADPLSIKCRKIAKNQGKKVRFDEDILTAWKAFAPQTGPLVGEVRTAWRVRNWFAHGRTFIPKLGRKPDFFEIEALALAVKAHVL